MDEDTRLAHPGHETVNFPNTKNNNFHSDRFDFQIKHQELPLIDMLKTAIKQMEGFHGLREMALWQGHKLLRALCA